MSAWWRQGTSGRALALGIALLVMGILTACAGPGGEGIATIGAAATASDRLTTPAGTASATASAAAATGTTAGRTVGAAVSSAETGSVASGTAARSPVTASSVTAGSAASGTRPTAGSATPGAAGSATRPTTGSATTSSATTGSATAGTAATRPATTTASMAASMAVIPPPPNGMEYMPGSNMIIDTILMAAEMGLNSSSDSVAVTSSKDYVSTSTVMDVGAFYRMQMPTLGWKSEQDQNSASGITTLVFSRDNQTNAALILIVDLTQVNQKGCLVITATAKPK